MVPIVPAVQIDVLCHVSNNYEVPQLQSRFKGRWNTSMLVHHEEFHEPMLASEKEKVNPSFPHAFSGNPGELGWTPD